MSRGEGQLQGFKGENQYASDSRQKTDEFERLHHVNDSVINMVVLKVKVVEDDLYVE